MFVNSLDFTSTYSDVWKEAHQESLDNKIQ